MELESWTPETQMHKISSSVTDFFQCLWQTVTFFLSVVQVAAAHRVLWVLSVDV